MGTSKLWYYPGSGGGGMTTPTVETIDFGETVSDFQIRPYRVMSDALSIGGAFSRSTRRVGMSVRIVNERFTDDALAEKLYCLHAHMERGGAFSFAVDSDNIFCAFVKAGVAAYRGEVSLTLDTTLFGAYGGTTLTADDVIHIECPPPRGNREESRVDGFAGAVLTLPHASPLKYDHDGPVMVRHRDFMPALFWPERESGNPPLTHDHRISWSWDLTAEVYPAHMFHLWAGEGPGAGSTDEEQGGGTLDDAVGGGLSGEEATEADEAAVSEIGGPVYGGF